MATMFEHTYPDRAAEVVPGSSWSKKPVGVNREDIWCVAGIALDPEDQDRLVVVLTPSRQHWPVDTVETAQGQVNIGLYVLEMEEFLEQYIKLTTYKGETKVFPRVGW